MEKRAQLAVLKASRSQDFVHVDGVSEESEREGRIGRYV